MNTEKDGGQAFAQYRTDPWGNPVIENGMTLRDYFAAKAMHGILSNSLMGDSDLHESGSEWTLTISSAAYEFADAMLAERAK